MKRSCKQPNFTCAQESSAVSDTGLIGPAGQVPDTLCHQSACDRKFRPGTSCGAGYNLCRHYPHPRHWRPHIPSPVRAYGMGIPFFRPVRSHNFFVEACGLQTGIVKPKKPLSASKEKKLKQKSVALFPCYFGCVSSQRVAELFRRNGCPLVNPAPLRVPESKCRQLKLYQSASCREYRMRNQFALSAALN